jgi:hypothetical protein
MTTTIKARLRAAIFTGAVGLLPSVALANDGDNAKGTETTASVPDHATAEARGAGAAFSSLGEEATSVPDHATAEAQSQGQVTRARSEETPGVPDHATAERASIGEQ